MSGFWFVVTSVMVYNLVLSERYIATKHAKAYQRQKSKVSELRHKLKDNRNNSQH